MSIVTVKFDTIELAEPFRGRVQSALDSNGSVLATWNLKLDGRNSLNRQRITRDQLENGNTIILRAHQEVNTANASTLEVRFKLEIDGVSNHSPIVRRINAPFANRDERSPSGSAAESYVLNWLARNDQAIGERMTEESSSLAAEPGAPATQNSQRAAARASLTTLAPTGSYCFARTPAIETTLIVGNHRPDGKAEVREYTTEVPDFRNWSHAGWRGNKFFSNLTDQRHKNCVCRPTGNVNSIVIHETAGYLIDTGYPASKVWLNGSKHGGAAWARCTTHSSHFSTVAAHFCVHTDGSVAQHFDTAQRLSHAGARNVHSVGIEIATKGWFRAVDRPARPASPATATRLARPFRPKEDADARFNSITEKYRLPGSALRSGYQASTTKWWGASTSRYVVCSVEQLEAVYLLVKSLRFLLAVPNVWMPMHDDGSGRFLMNQWAPKFGASAANRPGIYTHHQIGPGVTKIESNKGLKTTETNQRIPGHVDGSFPALYCWLRSEEQFCPKHARDKAIELCNGFPDGQWDSVRHRGEDWTVNGKTYNVSYTCWFLKLTDVHHDPRDTCRGVNWNDPS